MYYNYIRIMAVLISIMATTACLSGGEKKEDSSKSSIDSLHAVEKRLDTKPEFHVCAAPDSGDKCNIYTSYPAYIVAIEKADKVIVGPYRYKDCQQDTVHCFNMNASYYEDREVQRENIENRLNDKKAYFISHIIRFDPAMEGQTSNASPKQFLYNVYQEQDLFKDKKAKSPLVEQSWNVLTDKFASDLLQQIDKTRATHIVVYSTGWNTPQEESINDLQSWFDQLKGHDSNFKPIYVGFTWSSLWGKLGNASYCNKAHDADEIGYSWANILINQVLKSAAYQRNVKIVVVGHSFGARLLSRAVHSEPLLSVNRNEPYSQRPIDLFIGLQGAFPYKRFLSDVDANNFCFGKDNQGGPYRDFPLRSRKFLFTSSTYDTAVDKTFEDTFIGNDAAFTETERAPVNKVFEHEKLLPSGDWETPPSMNSNKIAIFDASKVVKDEVKKNVGSCTSQSPCSPHSDVFDKEIGRFVWDSIERYAPNGRLTAYEP